MERVRHQLACANCMLANANPPVNKDYRFFCKTHFCTGVLTGI